MKTFVRNALIVVITICVVGGVAWKLRSVDASAETIKVGAILSLTGTGSAYGEPARDGLKLAADAINAQGGIGGKKIELVFEDSRFDPKVAVNAYQSLSARGIRYFISNGSSVSVALRKLVVENHQFLFETAAVTPLFSDGKSNTCRLTLTADVAGKKTADFLLHQFKARSIAFLTLNDEFGTAVRENVSQSFIAGGGSVIAQESFDKTATDFRTQIAKLKGQESSIDALIVIPAAGQAEAVFKQLKELGWNKQIVSDNWTIINQNLKDRSLAEGVYFSNYDWQLTVGQNDTSAMKAFKQAFQATYHTDPPVVAVNAYDSMQLLAKGLTAVGVEQPEKVGDWLVSRTQHVEGATGDITLNADCEATRQATIQQVQNGSFVNPVL